jgi:hypothetical protein
MVAPFVAAVHWDLFPCTHIVLTLAIDRISRFLKGKLQVQRAGSFLRGFAIGIVMSDGYAAAHHACRNEPLAMRKVRFVE